MNTSDVFRLLPIDLIVFFAFIIAVVSVGLLKSRHEQNSEDYFLAGRGLKWWLIGFSLIAANISTEQFIGMSGSAAGWLGLAIASYEWMAAITLVVVAFVFLPKFLRAGIYTIPEFMEYRYNHWARMLMGTFTVLIYAFVTFPAVVYSGALTVRTLFGYDIASVSWAIGIIAAIYVASGGLKACAWADLLQGSALIAGGAMVVFFALRALGAATPETVPALAALDLPESAGALTKFRALNDAKLHMVLPRTDPAIPWTALVLGLWIPNFYYWGLNQYITQRTLGSKSLAEGQKGIVFAAALKLIVPFIIVIPGIIAFNLFSGEMRTEAQADNRPILNLFSEVQASPDTARVAFAFTGDFAETDPDIARAMLEFNAAVAGVSVPADVPLSTANAQVLQAISERTRESGESIRIQKQLIGHKHDSAFALLIKRLIPPGLRGFMLAAILGAVISSLASMLNSASTIFTMDIYRKYLNPRATQGALVAIGRISVGAFVIIGCLVAPLLGDPRFGGIFSYIQEFQGYISPGILAVFVFGLIAPKAPPACGVVGLLLNPLIYFLLAQLFPALAFLDRMAFTFFTVLAVMGAITAARPLTHSFVLPHNSTVDLEPSVVARRCGWGVVLVTLALYAYFW
jgi:solute:Na+ symporter, SSS family